jgi:outer membrane protein assembly factor BamB
MDQPSAAKTASSLPAAVLLCLVFGVSCLSSVAADWPVSRGNQQQTGVATSNLPEKLEVLWKFKAGDSVNAPAAIVGDTAYVPSYDKHLYALSLDKGEVRWKFAAKGELRTSPAVRDGLVYIGDDDGNFYAIRAKEGTQAWTLRIKGEILSSPNFHGDRVIFGGTDEILYCLDAKSGDVKWKFQAKGAINCSTAIVDNKAFLTGCDPAFRTINLADGKEESAPELGIQGDLNAGISGDFLYVSNLSKNSVVAVNWKKGEITWEYTDEDSPFPFHSSVAVSQGLVIVGGRDKHVHAIDAAKGKRVWLFETRGRVDSSAVIVGERVFIGSNDGSLYEIDLKKGTRRWSMALGSPVNSAPAVGQNRLIVGTHDGTVYCFGMK